MSQHLQKKEVLSITLQPKEFNIVLAIDGSQNICLKAHLYTKKNPPPPSEPIFRAHATKEMYSQKPFQNTVPLPPDPIF